MNNSGQLIGQSPTSVSGDSYAFLWTATSGMVDLGTLGGRRSTASAINNSGHVVGSAATGDESNHAFLRTPTEEMVDFGVGSANAVNDHGQVVGSRNHAVVWTLTDGIVDRVDLGTLGGHDQLRIGRE